MSGHQNFPTQTQQPTMQQPIANPGMQLSPLNAHNKPFDGEGKRDWSFGLFDCFSDCGTCVFSWCCPCFQYGINQSRLEHLEKQRAVHPKGGEGFGGDCCIYGALLYFGCPCLIGMGGRQRVRDHYKVQGSGGTDCLTTWCCIPCSLTQESRELEAEEQALMGVPPKQKA